MDDLRKAAEFARDALVVLADEAEDVDNLQSAHYARHRVDALDMALHGERRLMERSHEREVTPRDLAVYDLAQYEVMILDMWQTLYGTRDLVPPMNLRRALGRVRDFVVLNVGRIDQPEPPKRLPLGVVRDEETEG